MRDLVKPVGDHIHGNSRCADGLSHLFHKSGSLVNELASHLVWLSSRMNWPCWGSLNEDSALPALV